MHKFWEMQSNESTCKYLTKTVKAWLNWKMQEITDQSLWLFSDYQWCLTDDERVGQESLWSSEFSSELPEGHTDSADCVWFGNCAVVAIIMFISCVLFPGFDSILETCRFLLY